MTPQLEQRNLDSSVSPQQNRRTIRTWDQDYSVQDTLEGTFPDTAATPVLTTPGTRLGDFRVQHHQRLDNDAGTKHHKPLDDFAATQNLNNTKDLKLRAPDRRPSADSAILRVPSFVASTNMFIDHQSGKIDSPYPLRPRTTTQPDQVLEDAQKKDGQPRKVRHCQKIRFTHRSSNSSSEALSHNNPNNSAKGLHNTSTGLGAEPSTARSSGSKPIAAGMSSRLGLPASSESGSIVTRTIEPSNTKSGSSPTLTTHTSPKPKLGLYCRTKKRLGFKLSLAVKKKEEVEERRSVTKETLDEASGLLQVVASREALQPLVLKRRSNLSVGDISFPSSVFNFVRCRTPVVTPEPVACYKGSDDQGYFRVEISNKNGPTFLPSEAQLVGTQGVGDSLAERPRGFFAYPGSEPADSESTTINRKETAFRNPDCDEGGDRIWFKWKARSESGAEGSPAVEQDIPEHLPNSPLCPMHPKHSQKGKGFCPVHGRRTPSPDELYNPV